MNRAAARGVTRRPRDERGQVLALAVGGLVTFIMLVALAIDGGYGFWVKRSLQASADAGALAGAQALPNPTTATNVAYQYSGRKSPQGLNYQNPLDTTTQVTTECRTTCPSGEVDTVIVRETASVPTFFARVLGIGSYNVTARAVASKASVTTTGGTNNLAVYVHGLCEGGSGSFTGPVGLGANGKNMLIQGGIHINGNLKIGDSGFRSEALTTIWRPVHADSPAYPGRTQGNCKGSSPLFIENLPDARYCTLDCAPGEATPRRGPYRDWVTPYHTFDIARPLVRPAGCTHTVSTDVNITGVIPDARVYCLPADKKFTLTGTVTGTGNTHARITVFAGMIEINSQPGTKLRPYNDDHPVLFWSRNTGGTPISINPSGSLDWIGYVINRLGGMNINSGGVVSPREGLLEGEWININGENFTMLGRGPGGTGGTTTTISGPVSLTE